jgi:phosphoribosyl 1,2-cyclic phosphodiesterase
VSSLSAIATPGFDITFHGVRGSTPCHGGGVARYGGNTSCVSVDVPGHRPIMFDLGTGARYFGVGWPADQPFDGVCLLSHLHWDHVQGLPFFTPVLRPGSRLDLHAPLQEDGTTVEEVVQRMLCPPLFPVRIADLPGEFLFHEHGDDDFRIGEVEVMSRLIPHLGNTLGYRLSWGGASVAYLSDHQQPGIDVYEATDNARELCRGVDVMIHDAQYTQAEFEHKSSWGHCTIDYAVWLALECDARTLVLYHHDPQHDDDQLDRIVAEVRERVGDRLEVIGAREGLTMHLGR